MILILCKTVCLEVFYNAAVTTLVEINFERKKNDNYFSKLSMHGADISPRSEVATL